MTLRRLLPILALVACGDDTAHDLPVECTRSEPVQLVPGAWSSVELQRAGDTTFLVVRSDDGGRRTYAGDACGADPVLLADGARLLPTQIALDPRDDDPTLVCEMDEHQNFRVDLDGERPPELIVPYLTCPSRPTMYGALFIGGSGYLRLFADFPDESTATHIRDDGGNDLLVLDEWIIYTYSSDLHAYAFSTGAIIDIPGHVLGILGSGDHVLWFDYEDMATATLVDLRSESAVILGTFDRDEAWAADYIPGVSHWTWGFDPSGRYIYHVPPGRPPEAFDLGGNAVSLPVPGDVLRVVDGGVLSVTRDDGRVYFTRPTDPSPTALDLHVPNDVDAWKLNFVDDHLEQVIDGDLMRIDLDGSGARRLAADVGLKFRWLDSPVLVMERDDATLERLDTTSGERRALAGHVGWWDVFEGGVYFVASDDPDLDDGLWYLSPAALGSS